MGGWLTGSLLMWVVATENFRRVDQILVESRPELKERIAPMKDGDARLMLRYLASELNRFYFRTWGAAQLFLGSLILALSWWDRSCDSRAQRLVGVMCVLSAILFFLVTPQLVHIGRQVDFLSRMPAPPQMATFWRLHLAYTLADVVKVGLGVWVLSRLVRSPLSPPSHEHLFQ